VKSFFLSSVYVAARDSTGEGVEGPHIGVY